MTIFWTLPGMGCTFWIALVLVLVVPQAGAIMDATDKHQQRLYYDLFIASSYNNLIRPVVNTNDSLQINFTLSLSAIINVDAKNQVIITNVWLQMYWYDYQLVWNASNYGGITQIKVNYTKMWVPDVVLFNNADGNFEVSYSPNCVLLSNGSVSFIPPAIYTSSCSIDVRYFPFDEQTCEMKFGSWTFEGKTLVYNFHQEYSDIYLMDYMKNGAWDVIGGPGRIDVINDSMTGQPKEIIVYALIIRRKTLFYTVNLIIPCFLHALVCLCVFVVPAHKLGKKITLVINVLVSLVVLLLLLQKILPTSHTVPLIAKYFIFTFIMNVLEIFVAILTIFAHNRTPRMSVMPQWMCWLFLYKLPKFLLMERPNNDNRWQPKSYTPPPSYPNTPQVTRACIHQMVTDSRRFRPVCAPTLESSDVQRVQDWRHKFRSRGPSRATMSSSTSGSCFTDEDSPTYELREYETPHHPANGHSCFIRDSGTSQSEESLDHVVKETRDVNRCEPTRTTPPVLSRDIYRACNAIKFICKQTQNKEDYNMVLDDWKFLSAVIDRLLMIIYVLVSLSGTMGVLLNAPHILGTQH